MITDRVKRLGRWSLIAVTAVTVWLAGLVLVTAAVEPTGAVAVIAPDRATLLRAVGAVEDLAWLDAGERMMVVTGPAGVVRRLYAEGVWIVLPARRGGCARGFPT